MSTTDDHRRPEHDPLVAVLGEVLDATEGAPDAAVEVAVGLFALRRLDAELLEVLEDSRREGLAMRGDDEPRVLAFAGPDYRLDLEVTSRALVGELDPPGAGALTLVAGDRRLAVPLDHAGRFLLEVPGIGPCRLEVVDADGRRRATPVIVP